MMFMMWGGHPGVLEWRYGDGLHLSGCCGGFMSALCRRDGFVHDDKKHEIV